MAIGTPVGIGSLANKINTATYNIALTGAIQAGDLVLVNIAHAAAFTVVSVSDGTNTYAPAVWTSAAGSHYGTYYKQNASAVASGNVTVTLSGSSNSSVFAATVCRVSGVATVALDSGVNAANTGQTGTAYTQACAGNVAAPNEIVVANISINGPVGDALPTWASSFLTLARTGTTGSGPTTNLTIASGYRIVASTATYTATATLGASRSWNGNITSFKSADQSHLTLPAANALAGSSPTFGVATVRLVYRLVALALSSGPATFSATVFRQHHDYLATAIPLASGGPSFGVATIATNPVTYHFTALGLANTAPTANAVAFGFSHKVLAVATSLLGGSPVLGTPTVSLNRKDLVATSLLGGSPVFGASPIVLPPALAAHRAANGQLRVTANGTPRWTVIAEPIMRVTATNDQRVTVVGDLRESA